MLILLFKVTRTFLTYLFLGGIFGGICSPLLPFIKENNLPFRIWLLLDLLICTIAHNTDMRTVSGWTGQHMKTKPRYQRQAKVIDLLAELVGNGPNHCFRAYQWEIKMGRVKR
jgi:hypothetical protein